MSKIKAEYIWIDGYAPTANLRSKTKIVNNKIIIKETFTRAWQLNERHYGALTGLNKD